MIAGRVGAEVVTADLSSLRMRQTGGDGVSTHYVPGRNSIMLSMALSLAESRGCSSVFIGPTAEDRAGFPDCRPEFYAAWGDVVARGMASAVEIKTPLISLSKAEVVTLGNSMGVDFSATWSCYKRGPLPCGACGACEVRRRGFCDAGVRDPLEEK